MCHPGRLHSKSPKAMDDDRDSPRLLSFLGAVSQHPEKQLELAYTCPEPPLESVEKECVLPAGRIEHQTNGNADCAVSQLLKAGRKEREPSGVSRNAS